MLSLKLFKLYANGGIDPCVFADHLEEDTETPLETITSIRNWKQLALYDSLASILLAAGQVYLATYLNRDFDYQAMSLYQWRHASVSQPMGHWHNLIWFADYRERQPGCCHGQVQGQGHGQLIHCRSQEHCRNLFRSCVKDNWPNFGDPELVKIWPADARLHGECHVHGFMDKLDQVLENA